MTRKKKVAAETPATVAILIAVMTLCLGKDPETGDPIELPGGEELTPAKREALGLTAADVQSLVDSGHLTKIDVRAAAVGDVAGADTAAQTEIADLKAKLAEEKKRADDAEADYADLEKHVTVLEDQIRTLGGEPAPQDTPPADDKADKA